MRREYVALLILTGLLFSAAPLKASGVTAGATKRGAQPRRKYKRVNPHGWFSLLIPADMPPAGTFADVDGGSYENGEMEIKFTYWARRGEPNFMRNADGERFPPPRTWHCSKEVEGRIDKQRAFVTRCRDDDPAKDYRYVYLVNFPTTEVRYGEESMDGTFSLTIKYKHSRRSRAAERIARSLDFSR
jgi:hypothetical protein